MSSAERPRSRVRLEPLPMPRWFLVGVALIAASFVIGYTAGVMGYTSFHSLDKAQSEAAVVMGIATASGGLGIATLFVGAIASFFKRRDKE